MLTLGAGSAAAWHPMVQRTVLGEASPQRREAGPIGREAGPKLHLDRHVHRLRAGLLQAASSESESGTSSKVHAVLCCADLAVSMAAYLIPCYGDQLGGDRL